jgi:RNA polymerase sigma factor (sigma-70 family)
MTTTNVVSITQGTHRARVRARRDELVLGHLSLAAGIAHAVARTLPRAAFEREDLVAEAYAALIGAATTWRPEAHGDAPFACWARLKVRGAVLDAVRDQWSDGRHKHGTRPLTVAIDRDDRRDDAPDAADALDAARLRRRVARAIATLPAPEAAVLERKYGADEETFAQIGARLALPRKRIAKLHASAIACLRRELRAAA